MPAGDNVARFTNGLDMQGQQAVGFRDPLGPQEADTKAARDAAIQAAVDIITGLMATDAEVAAAVSFAVSAHEADTSNVHGIADTTVLATNTSVATAVSNAITALALGTAAQKNHGTGSADLPTVSHVSSLISTAINALVNGAPGLLDTLDELAQALGDDPNFAATITTALAAKADSSALTAGLATKADLSGGKVPVAQLPTGTTSAHVTVGDDTRVVKRTVELLLSDPNGSALAAGDSKAYFRVPSWMNGATITSVGASASTPSSAGLPTAQIRKVRAGSADVDVLSTKVSLDATEIDSSTAATAAVVDGSKATLATGDQLHGDVDIAGTGTKGFLVSITVDL